MMSAKPEQVNTITLIYLNHFGMPAFFLAGPLEPNGGDSDGQEEGQGAKRSEKIAPDR